MTFYRSGGEFDAALKELSLLAAFSEVSVLLPSATARCGSYACA